MSLNILSYPIRRHIVKFHGFADDTQLYCRLSRHDHLMRPLQVQAMELCISDIRTWMRTNRLKLNDSKTEVIAIANKGSSPCINDIRVTIGDDIITPKPSVRNLGAIVDSHLTMQNQVNAVTSSMYYNIRRISKVKRYLTHDLCVKAINATVLSRLDYHNGLLLGVPATTIHKLQVAQNNAARLLTSTPRREHISPVLQQLHWLPVKQRVSFKILTLIHKALHSDVAPSYMSELCPMHHSRRVLRSSSDTWRLQVSRASNRYGTRSLRTLGAQLWNELPAEVRGPISHSLFRKRLKTILFKQTFY